MEPHDRFEGGPGPRWLYLHGFGSGPRSAKGLFLSRHFKRLGVDLQRLNLRVPSMEHLRLSAMVEETRRAIGQDRDRAVLFGSSLGGLTACRLAESDARVCALVLLAPAFRFAERWASRPEYEQWRQMGKIDAYDYVENRPIQVDFDFALDAISVDSAGSGWPDVRIPCLIVHGVQDDVVEIERSRSWAAGKNHVRLVEVDDGHDLLHSLDTLTTEAERFLAPYLGSAFPRIPQDETRAGRGALARPSQPSMQEA